MEIAGWENLYRSGQRGNEEHPTVLLVETAAMLKPGKAADLACGTGRNAIFLAERGWEVLAVDGSESAIAELCRRAAERRLEIDAQVADLNHFKLPASEFDLVLIAFYLQRDLFPVVKAAVRPGGVVIAIAHTPEHREEPSPKRANPGELGAIFSDWEVLHEYEGASRDPAHKRPVAEIVARRPG